MNQTVHAQIMVFNLNKPENRFQTCCGLDPDQEAVLGNALKIASSLHNFLKYENQCLACHSRFKRKWHKTIKEVVNDILPAKDEAL